MVPDPRTCDHRTRAVRPAAVAGPPAAAALWATTRAHRHAGAAVVVRRPRELGPLRPGLADDVAVDVVWVPNDPGRYGSLVLGRGWAVPGFTAWLPGRLRAGLLGRDGGG